LMARMCHAKKPCRSRLPHGAAQGSMTQTALKLGRNVMARVKAKAGSRTKKTAARRTPARKRGVTMTPKPRRPHKFVKSHLRDEDFKSDGLRTYAHYRDLGVGQCDPKVVSKNHLHEADFQMIYVLKGSITTEIDGHGVHKMHPGDCWLQPHSAVHKVLDYSDGCEVLEIVMPAKFRTVELEK
jgi:mannose-6-phosphate isomerase-like protein (cupin superfamily)